MIIILHKANLDKSLHFATHLQVVRDASRLLLLNMSDLLISDIFFALNQLISVEHGHETLLVLLSLLLDIRIRLISGDTRTAMAVHKVLKHLSVLRVVGTCQNEA